MISNRMNRRLMGVLSGLLLLPVAWGADISDRTVLSPGPQGYLERARTMLRNGAYNGVIDQLRILDTRNTDFSLLDQLDPTAGEAYVYMLADALYERGDEECIRLLREFARTYPASPAAMQARLSIGDYYFFAHSWEKALEEYENTDMDRLNVADRYLYTYRRALCLLKLGSTREAEGYFRSLASVSEYKEASAFYLAYIDYSEGNIDKAYQEFSKIKKGREGLEAGYYLAEIDYARGDYAKVIERTEPLVQPDVPAELRLDMLRITGLAYFKRGDYTIATPYLKSYLADAGDAPESDALYAMGVIDYEEGRYDLALRRFSSLTSLSSAIGQSALLYTGQCDLRTGNADAAAMAFEKAAAMDYDAKVTERALYDYVAAVTRGGKIPFSSSAALLEKFIASYPDSEHVSEVKEYLAVAYYNDHEYKKALEKISTIKRPSAQVSGIKQKILYELGVECVSNADPKQGAAYLRQAVELGRTCDPNIAAQARLWLGDALYARQDYKGARQEYSEAARTIPASANRTLSLYDLAYSSYMLENYSAAASDFAKALGANPSLPAPLKADAMIRRADCLYYTGDHAGARKLYAEAIAAGAPDADYATYRHAIMTGLAHDVNGKLSELAAMERAFPNSRWLPDAMFEQALTYQGLGRSADANKAFRNVVSRFPDAAQSRQALLNVALERMKSGNPAEGTAAYKEIIEKWPSSEEASIATDDLKKYYASQGEIRELVDFLAGIPGAPSLNSDELEQLAFEGAETAYAADIRNTTLLRRYVADYPAGKYLAPALYDIALSLNDAGNYSEAEEMLSKLIAERPHSAQTPEALLLKAEILETKLPGRKRDALAAYRELEKMGTADFLTDARAGVMRTSDAPAERLEYAAKVRNSGGVSADKLEEAALCEAEALAALGRNDEAVAVYSSLASNPSGLAGAKAAVGLARLYLGARKWEEARKVAESFTDEGTPHQYWLAQGYIALADAYEGLGRRPLALEYIESLKANYPGKEADIAKAISSRIAAWKK